MCDPGVISYGEIRCWSILGVKGLTLFHNRSDEGLTLETSAFKLFTVANLRFQLG